jgi:hypothetical protein
MADRLWAEISNRLADLVHYHYGKAVPLDDVRRDVDRFRNDPQVSAARKAIEEAIRADEAEKWREALEQTNEALIVARRLSPTRKGPDFPGDPADMVYHGSVGHSAGMACEVCDYENAFDALTETNRALLSRPEASE